MLTSIQKLDAKKVAAWEVTKADGPFSCPKCQSETILRKGMIKIPHFAHKPPIFCEYGKGESEHHRRCKNEIYLQLVKHSNITVELEKDLGNVVPDIFIDFGEDKLKVAIEVQISQLTMSRIISRTSEYNRLGIYVLWLPIYDDILEEERYSPKAWEKWLHATYYGRVYYWVKDLLITPVHFDEYQLYVEDSEWYESGGELRSEGGYYKRSKRYRTPKKGTIVDFAKDFKPNTRRSWSGGDIVVPECKILVDKQQKWW